MQRISFAANCQACHSLQFDPKNPELVLPHGNATAVRAFLRSLPTQYADLAVKKGITRQTEIQSFVAKQMTQLRERVRSGEDFERQIFFTADPYKPQRVRRNGNTRIILRLRLLSRSETGGEHRASNHETDSGRSLDGAIRFRSRQTLEREMR